MITQQRAAADGRGVANEAVASVTGPPNHAVDVAPALRGDGAVEWGVWCGAVQC